MLLVVHSDDFTWFGDKEQMDVWKLLVDTFEKHKYKVSDVTDSLSSLVYELHEMNNTTTTWIRHEWLKR